MAHAKGTSSTFGATQAVYYLDNEHAPADVIKNWLDANEGTLAGRELTTENITRVLSKTRFKEAWQNLREKHDFEILDEPDHADRGGGQTEKIECSLCGKKVKRLPNHLPTCTGSSDSDDSLEEEKDKDFPDISDLREGARYNREALHQAHGGAKYRGIAPSADHPYIFIFTGKAGEEHGYKDEFRGDTFIYTGEGQEGDMEWSMGNKAIRNHKSTDTELHLFESNNEAWQVTYLGQYECVDWFKEALPDQRGNMRQGIRFKLDPVENNVTIPESDIDDLDIDRLYEQAIESSPGTGKESGETASTSSKSQTSYTRSEIVKKYALRVADGICQGCGKDAPFISNDGNPYLEVHHLHRRSDGGPDHPDNVIALCPNCHRRVHHGKDGAEFNETLVKKTQ
ncbi:HNH endonuclease signature motif containing protein [Haloarcula sp. CBA1127]|uniref:HNH endonuclease n=1 Tax=Haloarcula sp. CBA1127 TaxID=1765055 RepID=UPI0009AD43C0|nr:HNH endonuclease signature motif containing protein [Haloarcula sp. CBA1127]